LSTGIGALDSTFIPWGAAAELKKMPGQKRGSALSRDWRARKEVARPAEMSYQTSRRLKGELQETRELRCLLRARLEEERRERAARARESRERREANRARAEVVQTISDKKVKKMSAKQVRRLGIHKQKD